MDPNNGEIHLKFYLMVLTDVKRQWHSVELFVLSLLLVITDSYFVCITYIFTRANSKKETHLYIKRFIWG